MTFIHAVTLIGALASSVSAHGHITGVVADGTYHQGYDPSMQFQQNPPAVVGWSCPECLDNGFVSPDMYSTSNIACHKSATPGQASAKVAAGGKIELQWTAWPESHKGPVLDYLAKCNGNCATASADDLKFFKINQSGLIDDSQVPGQWASDQLISNNNTWALTIPSSIVAGNYVLRHEIIALHSAGQESGAQNYPQCINIEVTGGGSDSPVAVPATALYKSNDPGILVNIYQKLTYTIPGPALLVGAGNAPQLGTPLTSAIASTSTSIDTSSAATSAGSASSSSDASIPTSEVQATSSTTSIASTGGITSVISTTPVPVPASEVAPAISQIASITADIPSTLLTATIPTALPTGGDNAGPIPSTPLPQGMTLKDLLDWVSYILRTRSRKGNNPQKNNRDHPRQFAAPFPAFPQGGGRPGNGRHHGGHGHRPYATGRPSGFPAFPTGVFPTGFPRPTQGFGGSHHSNGLRPTGRVSSNCPQPTRGPLRPTSTALAVPTFSLV